MSPFNWPFRTALALAFCAATLLGQQELARYDFLNQSLADSAHHPDVIASNMTGNRTLAFWQNSDASVTNLCIGSAWSAPGGFLEFQVEPANVGDVLALTRLKIFSGSYAEDDSVDRMELFADEDPGAGGDNFQTLVFGDTGLESFYDIDLSGTPFLQNVAGPVTFRIAFFHTSGAPTGNRMHEIDYFSLKGTVTDPTACYPSFATQVLSATQGSNAYPGHTDPTDALGNHSGTFWSGGIGGEITVAFDHRFSTTGSPHGDLWIGEYGNNDCYFVQLDPSDAVTEQAMQDAGLVQNGDFYDLGLTVCGDADIDIDAILPGFPAEALSFDAIKLVDDGSSATGSSDGFEPSRIKSHVVCPQPPMLCGPAFASVVIAATQGSNPLHYPHPGDVLGDDDGTWWAGGSGGEITLGFGNRFSTTGDSAPDVCIVEWADNDGYFVLLDPSNDLTEQALQGAGLVQNGDFYELGQTFVGNADIDIDAFVAGFQVEVLSFDAIKLVDDGGGNGFEPATVEAKVVCLNAAPDFAKIGDRIWNDVDCDGIQDADESGQPMVQVQLLDATGNIVDSTMTDMNGEYLFCVMPGTYSVRIFPDANTFMVTAQGQGTDGELDSDFDPSSQTAGPITVEADEIRRDIDAGLCLICNTVTAFANNNLPACGLANDPVMTATVPALGSIFTLSVDTDFPNVPIFVFFALGGPIPLPVPGSTCIIYPDLSMVTLLALENTDSNGDWSLSTVIPAMPILAGFEMTFQSRVCDPSNQGPVPGIPDFPSNASHIGIGCP